MRRKKNDLMESKKINKILPLNLNLKLPPNLNLSSLKRDLPIKRSPRRLLFL